MQVILNEHGYVHAYAIIGGFGSQSVTVAEPENINDFERNYSSYYLSKDGALIKNEEKQKEIEKEAALNALRSQREQICYPVINRGALWYSKLTAGQMEELDAWYQAWLDVTDTGVIPEKPQWLI